MTEPTPLPLAEVESPPRRRSRRRLFLALAVLILLAPLAPLALLLHERRQAELALEEAIAATDRLDPEWRWEQIEKRRTALPAEQNAATHIQAAIQTVADPSLWIHDGGPVESMPPQCQLDPKFEQKLRLDLRPLAEVQPLVVRALPLKSGWYKLHITKYGVHEVPHLESVRRVGVALRHVAALQSQDGNHADAWQSGLAILATARSFGDEPIFMAQHVRLSLGQMAVQVLERNLAQGSVSDAMLAEAQQYLAEEAAQPLVYYAVRGSRASVDIVMTNLESGKIDLEDLADYFHLYRGGGVVETWWLYPGATFKNHHAQMLNHFNEAAKYSKLPPAQMAAKMNTLQEMADEPGRLFKMFYPELKGIAVSAVNHRALLECAQAGLGAERFRLKTGRWPESLDEVVAANLLDTVPQDPKDGQPVRYRKTLDGVVIYSLSPAGNYAGDALDPGRKLIPTTPRYEFRLWNEDQRRQPPRPEAVEKKDQS